jgi:hypothetical protein
MAAVPADADALPFLPTDDSRAELVYDSGDFVTGNAGILNSWPPAFLGEDVAVADTAGLDPDAYLVCARIGDFSFDDFEIAAWPGDLGRLHR